MKKIIQSLLIVLAIACLGTNLSAKAPTAHSTSISLMKASKTLKAPKAISYKWYLNDELIELATDEISIEKAGTTGLK